MSNQLVKYDNKLNLITLKGLTEIETNVFFAMLYKLRDQESKVVTLDFVELKELINIKKNYTIKEISALIKNVSMKIAQSVIELETEKSFKFFTIFQVLEVPRGDDFYIKARISEDFAYMVNNLKQGFTLFELAEFTELGSEYTKTLYRLLKQFRSTGFLRMEFDEFVRILDIPKSYKMSDIDKQILEPSIKTLNTQTLFSKAPFKKLICKKQKTRGRGNKITHIEFYFTPEKHDKKELEKDTTALQKIAHSIDKEQRIKRLQNSPQMQLGDYLNRNIAMLDQRGKFNTLKIKKITEDEQALIVVVRNVDDNFENKLRFSSADHLANFFEKYSV